MLKKGKKFEDNNAPDSVNTVTVKNTTPLTPPVSKDEKTTIGEHIAIEGSIRGKENLEIEGSMKGNVQLEKHNFTIGSKGRVEGEINARNVSVSGQLNGAIKAGEKVKITKEADFCGEIKANSISVEDGAYFKGVIELEREPHRKSAITGAQSVSASSGQTPKLETSSVDSKKEK